MNKNKTDFSTMCEILSDLWLEFRDDEDFEDFMDYSDIGLPLAYGVVHELFEINPNGKTIVEETWNLLLIALELEDTGFESLSELLGESDEYAAEEVAPPTTPTTAPAEKLARVKRF